MRKAYHSSKGTRRTEEEELTWSEALVKVAKGVADTTKAFSIFTENCNAVLNQKLKEIEKEMETDKIADGAGDVLEAHMKHNKEKKDEKYGFKPL